MKMTSTNNKSNNFNSKLSANVKTEYESKSDMDDIENLLTVHVMCKSVKQEDSDDGKEKNSSKELKNSSNVILNQPVVLLERNIEQKIQQSSPVFNRRDKKRNYTNLHPQQVSKKIKNDLVKSDLSQLKMVTRHKKIDDTNVKVYNTRIRTNSASYLKVKSQEALGLNQTDNESGNEEYVQRKSARLESLNQTSEKSSKSTPSMNENCRLCGGANSKKINVFSNSTESRELINKIRTHLNIEIRRDDHLSHSICSSCSETIIKWSQFYKNCSVFQQKIKNYINNSKMYNSSDDKAKNSELKDFNQRESGTSDSIVDLKLENIKKETVEVEDNIEKMLREMHGLASDEEEEKIESNQNNEQDLFDGANNEEDSDEDFEMNVEFLEEERELVDEALLHQKNSRKKVSEPSNGKKIIRMDRKLSENELRSLLERTNCNDLTTVTVIKTSSQSSTSTADIDKHYKELKEKLAHAKEDQVTTANDNNLEKSDYEQKAKSYSRFILEHIKTETEMFFRCPDCRIYLPSSDLPRHVQSEHAKITALCDFCRLLLPYNTSQNKNFVREHITLHKAKKMSDHPDVIVNICKLLESCPEGKQPQTPIKKEDNTADFSSPQKMPVHKTRYRCNQCPARFQNANLIREHLKLHKTENISCNSCKAKFQSRFALNNHEKLVHQKNNKFLCENCNLQFEDSKTFETHMQMEQSLNPTVFICPHCSNAFTEKEQLLEHAKSHSIETFICTVCGVGFATDVEVKNHQEIHSYHVVSCVECGFKSFTQVGLDIHMRNCHPDSSNATLPFACDQCNKSFQTANKLREHVQIIHRITRNFQCPLCDWSFNHNVNLKRHFDFHVEKGHVNCKVCNKPFEYSGEKLEMNDVIFHKQTHTVEENFVYQRPYSPSVSRMTPWRDAVSTQGGARMFCRDCGLACSTPLELRKHQKTHKPFYCHTCNTVSNNEQTFFLHMEQHADRKHICRTCNKRFMTRTALNLHTRTHASSPKYVCSVCSRRFLIVTDWKRHERVCRETHGLPRMEYETANRRSMKRVPRQIIKYTDEEGQLIEYVDSGSAITYEYVEDETVSDQYSQELAGSESIDDQNTSYYVLQDENSDETIEIDETQLAEFQEWQRTASQTARKEQTIVRVSETERAQQSDDGGNNVQMDTSTAAPVYYSIEELPGNKKQYRFVPQYVTIEEAAASSADQQHTDEKYIVQTTEVDNIETTNSGDVLPEDDNQMIINENSNSIILNTDGQEEQNVVYVDSSNNIVYNIQNSMDTTNISGALQTLSGQNIIFQETGEEEEEQEDNSGEQINQSENISYVFNETSNQGSEAEDGSVTIYLKDGQVIGSEELNKISNSDI